MFGMTKKQFLKRSAKCMDETGSLLLLLKEVIDKEVQGKIDNQEASKKIEIIRKEIETIFFKFEKLNPPSKCFQLKQKILRALINFQEIVVDVSKHLAVKVEKNEKSPEKLKELRDHLEEFRNDFHDLTRDINTFLTEKKNFK